MPATAAHCPSCGRRVAAEPGGIGLAGQAVVVVSVFFVVLLGVVVMVTRQEALDAFAAASAEAVALAEREAADRAAEAAARPTPTPIAPPDAAGAGTYTVQRGDSLFSIAAAVGASANELIFWNADSYPSLATTPTVQPGWVLRTTGPTLEVEPEPTPGTELAGPGGTPFTAYGPDSFPATTSVTVGYYAVSGGTPQEIVESMEASGPWSEWLGERVDAAVQTLPSFNFRFTRDAFGACAVISTGPTPVTVTYRVTLPGWSPPGGVPPSTVDWWLANLEEMVVHEAQHITIWEAAVAEMNEAFAGGTCDSITAALERISTDASRANCEFDLAEYGYAQGYTLEACLEG